METRLTTFQGQKEGFVLAMHLRQMVGELRQQFEDENGVWNGIDDRVRWHGTFNKTQDTDSGLSILEKNIIWS